MSREIPISALQPSSLTSDTSIRGVIKLVWPYSQSSQTYAVLLAATDFHQRPQQDRVRITFSGPAANAVVKSNAGISDTLVVSLKSAIWHESSEVKTPGRSVDGELEFKNAVDLTVVSADGSTTAISINVPTPERETSRTQHIAPATPAPVASLATHPLTSTSAHTNTFESPAFLKRAHINVDLTADPFLEADDEEISQKRARTSFGTVRDWRYIGRSPSPVNENDSNMQRSSTSREQQALFVGSAQSKMATRTIRSNGVTPALSIPSMQPPALPHQPAGPETASSPKSQAPTTPKLHPVAASTLPLPSPFPNETINSLFEEHGPGNGKLTNESRKEEQPGPQEDRPEPALHPSVDLSMSGTMQPHVSMSNRPPAEAQPSPPSNSSISTPSAHAQSAAAISETVVATTVAAAATSQELHQRGSVDASTVSNAAGTQDLEQREQTRQQMLSSLFGFRASSHMTDDSLSTPRPQSHGRTLSDFEQAESQAMGQLMPVYNASNGLEVTGEPPVDQAIDKAHEPFVDIKELDIDHPLAQASKDTSMLPLPPPDPNGIEDEVALHAQQAQATEAPSLVGNVLAAADVHDMTQNGTATVTDFLSSTRQLHSASGTTPTSQHKHKPQDSHTRRTMQNTPSTRVGLNEATQRENELSPVRRQQTTFPEGLRKWMSPRDQRHNPVTKERTVTNLRVLPTVEAVPPRAGLQTETSYYTALGRLQDYFNVPGNRVDVIVMITSSPVIAGRLEMDEEDFFITFNVKDTPVPEIPATRVTLYSQVEAFLPRIAAGDVVLLRAMNVRSRSHRAILVSNDESAWAVWRYSELYSQPGGMAPAGKENQPSDRRLPVDDDVREEIRGPPIEYGAEERREVKRLKNSMLTDGELPAAFLGAPSADEPLQEREVPRHHHETGI